MTLSERSSFGGPGVLSDGTWRFADAEQLHALWPGARFTALGSGSFTAEVWRRRLPRTRLEGISATPYRCERDAAAHAAHPADVLTVNVVVEGTLHMRTAGHSLVVRAGEVFVHRGGEFVYECPEVSRTFRSAVAPSLLLEPQHRDLHPFEVRPRSVLTESFVGFAREVLRFAGAPLAAPTARHLEQALLVLQRGVIDEIVVRDRPADGALAHLRVRVLEHIEQHLTERDLTVETLLTRFGVSRRWLFRAFEGQPEGVAQLIRRRRVESATRELRIRPTIAVAELASRHGFAGRDQLTRAFRAHHGVPPDDYRAALLQDPYR